MTKNDAVKLLLGQYYQLSPVVHSVTAFAPTNIALCKYWGKRDVELNLPVTSSLSITLPSKGTDISLQVSEQDKVILNGVELSLTEKMGKRVCDFFNLVRAANGPRFHAEIKMNIPLAAGLASSASGFAAVTRALNQLFAWNLPAEKLSILARMGSGSAARSLWNGFVEWHVGKRGDGMDSFAESVPCVWPELCVGLLVLSDQPKSISSREAMERTVQTSILYGSWPQKVATDLPLLKQAIAEKNFSLLGATAESNALAMHATMLSTWPPVCYYMPQTVSSMHTVWQLRQQGVEVYFTQDAGPNLKLLFLAKDAAAIKAAFPDMEVINVF